MPRPDPAAGLIDVRERFAEELTAVARRTDVLEVPLTPIQAWATMAQLQLAARHPDNAGITKAIAQEVARRLQALIAPPGSLLATVAEMGWSAQYDVPPDVV